MIAPVNRIKQFYHETMEEVRRCTWPGRRELADSTLIVIVTLILLTVFIWGVDSVLQVLVRLLLRLSGG